MHVCDKEISMGSVDASDDSVACYHCRGRASHGTPDVARYMYRRPCVHGGNEHVLGFSVSAPLSCITWRVGAFL